MSDIADIKADVDAHLWEEDMLTVVPLKLFHFFLGDV
jgi:hypothetical protein